MIEPLLKKVTALIVRACDPEEVLLFGSYAKGRQNIDSDLDILVVGNFPGSAYLVDLELRQLLRNFAIPMDLHIVTPRQLAAESSKPFGFLRCVLFSGKVLYRNSVSPKSI